MVTATAFRLPCQWPGLLARFAPRPGRFDSHLSLPCRRPFTTGTGRQCRPNRKVVGNRSSGPTAFLCAVAVLSPEFQSTQAESPSETRAISFGSRVATYRFKLALRSRTALSGSDWTRKAPQHWEGCTVPECDATWDAAVGERVSRRL